MRASLMILVCCALVLTAAPADAAFQPDAAAPTIAFDHGGDIYVTDFTGDPVALTTGDAYDIMPLWSPDGTQIAFLSAPGATGPPEGHRLHIVTVETGAVRALGAANLSSEADLAWSPDGRYIAVALSGLFVIDTATGDTTRLTTNTSMRAPAWTADGERLVFQSGGELYVIDADGRNLRLFANPAPPYSWDHALAPATNDVVYLWADEDRPGLHRVNIDGGETAIVAEMPGYTLFRPQWSPDGQMIAFTVWGKSGSDVDVPGGSDVYVVDRDGANLRGVTGDAQDGLIGWTPDGTRILYWAGEPGSASGAFYMVDVNDGTSTLLSGPEMNIMCSYNNCPHVSIRPG